MGATPFSFCGAFLIIIKPNPVGADYGQQGVSVMREWLKALLAKYWEEPFCQAELARAEMLRDREREKVKLRVVRGHKEKKPYLQGRVSVG